MRMLRGLLGWSNKRDGVEFYRYDPKVVPRHGSEWGDLLVNEDGMKGQEGSTVLVVVFPRNATEEDIVWVEDNIKPVIENLGGS